MRTTSPEETVREIKGSIYYEAIEEHYSIRKAERSGVPLIQHIDEGLLIMARSHCSTGALLAFCVHPLFQADEDLPIWGIKFLEKWRFAGPGLELANVMMLVMEYRNQANAWLSPKVHCGAYQNWEGEIRAWGDMQALGRPDPGPLGEVRMMLIGDKVQNRKDFLRYHKGTHPRSAELDLYFRLWLDALGIDEAEYTRLVAGL